MAIEGRTRLALVISLALAIALALAIYLHSQYHSHSCMRVSSALHTSNTRVLANHS